MIDGCLERLTSDHVSGWVCVSKSEIKMPVVIRLVVSGNEVARVIARTQRPDIVRDGVVLGFHEKVRLPFPINPDSLEAIAEVDGNMERLKLWAPLDAALRYGVLSESGKKSFVNSLDPSTAAFLFNNNNQSGDSFSGFQDRKKLCVITYANDSGAWFPYFYRYYSGVVGCDSIYVITPRLDSFSAYRLGGVISSGSDYNEVVRSALVSNLSAGLLALYEWTLVCDVDEIVVPHPCSGKTILDLVSDSHKDTLISRGVDILQMPDEGDFDFQLSVFDQRKLSIPNTAMCKPHLTRIPVRYSGGYHYTNFKHDFSAPCDGIVTLHLKWACSKIRKSVLDIVNRTSYADPNIARYSANSVSAEVVYPGLSRAKDEIVDSFDSARFGDFERGYSERLYFDSRRKLWIGPHVTADFLVSLAGYSRE